MFDHANLLLAAGIMFVAAFLQGFAGFGLNLFAVGLLSLIADVHAVVPMCVFVSGCTTWVLLWWNRRAVKLKAAAPLLIGAIVGVPPGVLVLSHLNAKTAVHVLGAVLISMALAQSLTNRSIIGSPRVWKATLAGLLGGVLGGAFGTAGPPIAAYLHLTSEPLAARTSLFLIFALTSIVNVAGHLTAGNANAQTFSTGLLLLPAAALGSGTGEWAAGRIKPGHFRQAVLLLLGLLGVALILRR